jgi:hypothetical protein
MQRWENPVRGRYYPATKQQNLFGEWELLRMWGSIGRAHGGMKCVPLPGPAAGELALSAVAKRGAQRGYAPVQALPSARPLSPALAC